MSRLLPALVVVLLACSPLVAEHRTPVIGPIKEDAPPLACDNPPDEARILAALPKIDEEPTAVFKLSRENVQIVTELVKDTIDPERFYPLIGPAQQHHCHWKCTVYYVQVIEASYPFPFRVNRPRTEVVHFDLDHLHAASPR